MIWVAGRGSEGGRVVEVKRAFDAQVRGVLGRVLHFVFFTGSVFFLRKPTDRSSEGKSGFL